VSWFEHWFALHEFQNHFTNAHVDKLKHMGHSLCYCSLTNNPLLCLVLNMLKHFFEFSKNQPTFALTCKIVLYVLKETC
jgi:hypothetical protein